MTLAISSLAWAAVEDREAASAMLEAGIRGVEIAPSRRWQAPLEASPSQVATYRMQWEDQGLEVVAIQSLLFGRPDLVLFETEAARDRLRAHLSRMCALASGLGARLLVFGAPRNRVKGALSFGDAMDIAVPFFRLVGQAASEAGVVFCIEPNPPKYGADFITSSTEGVGLVEAVGHPGFALHLDSACMTLAGEDPFESVTSAAGLLCHFHASDLDLGPLGTSAVDHAAFGAALLEVGYTGAVSAEMLVPHGSSIAIALTAAAGVLKGAYGGLASYGHST